MMSDRCFFTEVIVLSGSQTVYFCLILSFMFESNSFHQAHILSFCQNICNIKYVLTYAIKHNLRHVSYIIYQGVCHFGATFHWPIIFLCKFKQCISAFHCHWFSLKIFGIPLNVLKGKKFVLLCFIWLNLISNYVYCIFWCIVIPQCHL